MSEHIVVTGNITSVPERMRGGGDDAMVRFGLAATERRKEDGRWQDGHTSFYSVVAYRHLAVNALDCLEKGQRVIVVGSLRIKKWEAGERSGINADITASAIGPDLQFGVATFRKRTGGAAGQERGDEWATSGEHDAALDEPRPQRSEGAGESKSQPELVGAQGWSNPGDDTTPF